MPLATQLELDQIHRETENLEVSRLAKQKEREEKRKLREQKKRKQLLGKLVAPFLLIITILIGLALVRFRSG